MKSKNMRKKSVAVLAGIAIAGAVGASAASLGGLGGEDLGADSAAVESCDTDGITVGYTTSFDATAGEYLVDSIDLSDINADCATQTYDLTALGTDAAGDPVEEDFGGPVILTTDSDLDLVNDGMTIDTSGITLTAESVTGLAMTISGTTTVVTP